MEPETSDLGPVGRRRKHIDDLCREHGIRKHISAKGDRHAFANPSERRILVPETTRNLSYYKALHEIGHVVQGFDQAKLKAPQEAAAWNWAIENAIEPPTEGVRRQMFRAVWNYALNDLNRSPERNLSNAERYPSDPADSFWTFLANLDGASRLLYEAMKVTAHSGPIADARNRERELLKEQSELRRRAVNKARTEEQLIFYGPPSPARTGEETLLGSSPKVHLFRRPGSFGEAVGRGDIFCGVVGVDHPSELATERCERCFSIYEREKESGDQRSG